MNIMNAIAVLSHLYPASNNRVFFISFNGLYNDNPKYISEELHRVAPQVKIFWYISERSSETIPPYVRVIKKKNNRYYRLLNRCKVLVENGAGQYYAFVEESHARKYNLLKNKKQFDLATWHGTPLKRIGYDTLWDRDKFFVSTADIIIAGSKYEEGVFSSAFKRKIPIKTLGNARNDILINASEEDKARIKKKLGLSADKKIVIYAPTFREKVYSSENKHLFDYLMNLDVDSVIDNLSKRFGGIWEFVFRGHQMISESIDKSRFGRLKTQIKDGNLFDDMAEYLAVADVLITDFSGSLFDFLITGKPCFLYAPDYDDYVNYSHGIYGNITDLPYTMSQTNYELINAIISFNEEEFQVKRKEYVCINDFFEDGKASERIAQMIMDILRRR